MKATAKKLDKKQAQIKPAKKLKAPAKKKSPVEGRNVPVPTRCMLWGLAGGRCEFSGCNKLLLEHPVTSLQVNLADVAHVVGFSEQGPRGEGDRPDDIHALENLMLLCPDCHTQIDERPDDFSRESLTAYKRNHEARIRHVTGLGPDMGTAIVQLKAKIAGRSVDIPVSHVYEAVSPRWPTDRQGHVIDLSQFDIDGAEGARAAALKIDDETARLYRPGMDADQTGHISLFALAPMPVLMHLGSRLSDKIAIDFFQRHRDAGSTPWKWRNDGPPVDFAVKRLQEGSTRNKVALILSLSGPVDRAVLPAEISAEFSIYEMTPQGVMATPDFLRSAVTLERFRKRYRSFFSELAQSHGQFDELHVFPAVPAPIAVLLGHDLLPKVHPDLLAYDNDRSAGGFRLKLRIKRA